MPSNSRTFSTTSIYMLSVTDFVPKGTISEVSVPTGAKFRHIGCWLIAKCSQSSRRNRWISKLTPPPPPTDSPPRDLLITIVKETVMLYKKEFRKLKKSETCSYLSSIWKSWKRYWLRDCLWLSQACKRGFRPMQRNIHQEEHSYPQADICSSPHSDHDDTHTHTRTSDNRLWSPQAYGLTGL